jgi:hypothetical protein
MTRFHVECVQASLVVVPTLLYTVSNAEGRMLWSRLSNDLSCD